ncbi:RBBP8 N-terminal-like protein [Saguinus oedipus]|uniref:RBBP8 N-terminal-like protein n=1 Tax=Saguinus oedipus TaxID=9490 RepID=A0ABQ9VN50_SAGOE|nr:RBBP8 N-terminal-like protein [Saguinus oedipus]
MNALKEENEILKEEVKRLQGLGDKPKPPAKESISDPPSPLLLPSPGGWRTITEKPPGGHEEAEEDHQGVGPRGEEGGSSSEQGQTGSSPGQAAEATPPPPRLTCPAEATPPPPRLTCPAEATLPLPRLTCPSSQSPQHISNQLHGTIAVVRPGSQACPTNRGPANGTPPPALTRSSPPSPAYERSLPLDRCLPAPPPPPPRVASDQLFSQPLVPGQSLQLSLRAPDLLWLGSFWAPSLEQSSHVDTSGVARPGVGAGFLRASRPSTVTHEALKCSPKVDRLCLLNRPLSLHHGSPRSSPLAPAEAPRDPRLQDPKAREAEAWEEPTDLLGRPGALAGMQDLRLEGALHLLLAQQQLRARARAGSARSRDQPTPRETPPSPPVGLNSEGPESKGARATPATAVLPGGRHTQPASPDHTQRTEATATQDCAPDKPLDLSDRGRGRDAPKPAGQPGSLSPATAHAPSPEPPTQSRPLIRSPQPLSNGTKGTRAPEQDEASTPTVRSPAPGSDLSSASTHPHPHPWPPSSQTLGCSLLSTHQDGSQGEGQEMKTQGGLSRLHTHNHLTRTTTQTHQAARWVRATHSAGLGGTPPQATPSAGREALLPLTTPASPLATPSAGREALLPLTTPASPLATPSAGREALLPLTTPPSPLATPSARREALLPLTTPTSPQAGLSSQTEATTCTPREGPGCVCAQEHKQGLPRKRKRASEPEDKGTDGTGQARGRCRDGARGAAAPTSPQCHPLLDAWRMAASE